MPGPSGRQTQTTLSLNPQNPPQTLKRTPVVAVTANPVHLLDSRHRVSIICTVCSKNCYKFCQACFRTHFFLHTEGDDEGGRGDQQNHHQQQCLLLLSEETRSVEVPFMPFCPLSQLQGPGNPIYWGMQGSLRPGEGVMPLPSWGCFWIGLLHTAPTASPAPNSTGERRHVWRGKRWDSGANIASLTA